MHKSKKRSGFTLIELLVVIAIVAILAVVVVLVLNPAQLIQQARDSNRISDMATIKSAIAYYLQDYSAPVMTLAAGTCYTDGMTNTGVVVSSTCPWFLTSSTTIATNTSRVVNATSGWIPINLSLISVGSPIGQWPIDPINTTNHTGGAFSDANDHFYSYAGTSTNTGFKLEANMESTKYSSSGAADVESTDGGTYPQAFEQGSNLAL